MVLEKFSFQLVILSLWSRDWFCACIWCSETLLSSLVTRGVLFINLFHSGDEFSQLLQVWKKTLFGVHFWKPSSPDAEIEVDAFLLLRLYAVPPTLPTRFLVANLPPFPSLSFCAWLSSSRSQEFLCISSFEQFMRTHLADFFLFLKLGVHRGSGICEFIVSTK